MFLRAMDGDYYPSFFTIKLDTSDIDDDFVLFENSTFIHEYIHFIQDLILPYNIRMNLSYIKFFYNICNYGKINSKIEIPFTKWDKEEYDLKQTLDFTFGSKIDKKKLVISRISQTGNYNFTGYDSHTKSNRNLNVYKYEIQFINNSKYHMGARDLLEYIAYRIEHKHYNSGNTFPDYPYKTLDIIFDYYGYSKLSIEKRVIIAEYCLHNDNPIHFLFNIVFKKDFIKQIIHLSIYKAIHYLYRQTGTETADGKKELFALKERRRLDDFLEHLSLIYNHSDYLIKWIKSVNTYSKNKFQGTFIFTNLYLMNTDEFKSTIKEMTEELGLPLVINKKDKVINTNNDRYSDYNELEYFYIIEHFINFIESNNVSAKTCPICSFCKQNYKIKCNRTYDSKKEIQDCPYKNFLKINKIDEVKFQQNKK